MQQLYRSQLLALEGEPKISYIVVSICIVNGDMLSGICSAFELHATIPSTMTLHVFILNNTTNVRARQVVY